MKRYIKLLPDGDDGSVGTETKVIEQQNIPFILPTHHADFNHILGNNRFILVQGQLLFRDERGQPVITYIDENSDSYTEKEYNQLPESAPFQLIQGKLIYMPSPFDIHQKVLGNF